MLQLPLGKKHTTEVLLLLYQHHAYKTFTGISNKDTSFLAGTKYCRGEEKKEKY